MEPQSPLQSQLCREGAHSSGQALGTCAVLYGKRDAQISGSGSLYFPPYLLLSAFLSFPPSLSPSRSSSLLAFLPPFLSPSLQFPSFLPFSETKGERGLSLL